MYCRLVDVINGGRAESTHTPSFLRLTIECTAADQNTSRSNFGTSLWVRFAIRVGDKTRSPHVSTYLFFAWVLLLRRPQTWELEPHFTVSPMSVLLNRYRLFSAWVLTRIRRTNYISTISLGDALSRAGVATNDLFRVSIHHCASI